MAGTIPYEFTAKSMVPTVTDLPAGVTAENFVIGTGFGDLFDQGGGLDSLRITGTDGPPTGTPASYSANTVLSFSVTIPADRALDLETLTLRYKGNSVVSRSNARVYSNIRGHADATADTISIVGRSSGGTDASFVTSTVQLKTPSGAGANIHANDFRALTNRTVTFEIPWMDDNTTATQFIDLDDVTLTFTEVAVPGPVTPTAITNFEVLADRTARISFTGQQNTPYFLLASPDLTGPTYRKHWLGLTAGTFAAAPTIFPDNDADDFLKRFYVVTGVTEHPKARIMPVGDSITEGASTFTIYRPGLFDKLTTAGYHFQFVGNQSSTYASPVTGTTVTLKHEGYGGTNAEFAALNMASRLASNPADILLIHSGHNHDVAENGGAGPIPGIVNAHRSMITTARAANPKMIILMCKVITAGKLPKYSYIPDLNIQLGALAAELSTPASPVIVVDQADGFVWETDTIPADSVHPNGSGAAKMATKFFNALSPFLE